MASRERTDSRSLPKERRALRATSKELACKVDWTEAGQPLEPFGIATTSSSGRGRTSREARFRLLKRKAARLEDVLVSARLVQVHKERVVEPSRFTGHLPNVTSRARLKDDDGSVTVEQLSR